MSNFIVEVANANNIVTGKVFERMLKTMLSNHRSKCVSILSNRDYSRIQQLMLLEIKKQ